MKTTWKLHKKHRRLTMQSNLSDTVLAFPQQRREPLTDTQLCVGPTFVTQFSRCPDVPSANASLRTRGEATMRPPDRADAAFLDTIVGRRGSMRAILADRFC